MNITIVGAGNIGTQFAVHCSEKNHNITIYGSKPCKINRELYIVDESNTVIHSGFINKATSDEKIAFENADLIFVTMPAFCMKHIAEKIYPYVTSKTKICIVPGTGGGEFAFKECLNKGAIVFGLQRVPSVARLVEYGKCVRATGYRDELFVAAIPNCATEECCQIIESIFDKMKCSPLPAYLNLTLAPSNPILHTTRLRVLYKGYQNGVVYDNIPLFYEDWDDESSKLLFKCDDEVQSICNRINMFDLSYVKSLKAHYESYSTTALTRKMRSIKSFKGITSPYIKVENGFVPDFESRYFTADFPFGLAILVQIADFTGTDATNMKATLEWYRDVSGNKEGFYFNDYGINSLNDFISFYDK